MRRIGANIYNELSGLLQGRSPEEEPFEELIKNLRDRYVPRKLVLAERVRIMKTQKVHQTMEEFFTEIQKAAEQCELSSVTDVRDMIITMAFVKGIKSETFKQKLLQKDSLSAQESLRESRIYETALKEAQSMGERKEKLHVMECFNCGKLGHMARNCYKKEYQVTEKSKYDINVRPKARKSHEINISSSGESLNYYVSKVKGSVEYSTYGGKFLVRERYDRDMIEKLGIDCGPFYKKGIVVKEIDGNNIKKSLNDILRSNEKLFNSELGTCKNAVASLKFKEGTIIPKFCKWKKKWKKWICGDFKGTVNPWLDINQYSLPKPEDLFQTLNGGQKFSCTFRE
uniref:CCHC-type domain-containing protein n=1 Tax=Heterorhabditis bacteriophora TaxID=37862 RepID=A0A1I7WAM6_HETBA